MSQIPAKFDAVTVTLNPALDLTVTIRDFAPGAVNRVTHSRTNPGGKGVNVAAMLAEKGTNIAATGFLGLENSRDFEILFEKLGIKDRFVRIPGRTRTGIKITDPVKHETTDINFPGLSPSPIDVSLLRERLAGLDAPWMTIGGSIPPGIGAAVYHDLIVELKSRGSKVVLDASGDALRYGIEAAPHIIKPNIHELEALLGIRLSSRDAVIKAAQQLLKKRIEMVVVSMGAEGACFVTEKDVVVEHPPGLTVKSTVGAGDAMVAGIIAAQLRRLPLDECARLATSFSVEVLRRNASL